jgi:hypothetical protein
MALRGLALSQMIFNSNHNNQNNMIANIKWIIIGLFLLGCIALFIWGDKIQAGSIFAGIAAFIAAIKSKLFGNDKLAKKISNIRNSHEYKRRDWEIEKQEYESRYDSIKNRVDELNRRIEVLNEQLDKTSKPGDKVKVRSEEEILFWLKNN